MITDPSTIDLNNLLLAFALSISRIYCFLRFSPIFRPKNVTSSVQFGFMAALAIIPAPYVYMALQTSGPELIFVFFVKEIIVGLILAFFVWLPYHALEFSGIIVDTQRGLAMAQDFNSLTEATGTLTSKLLVQIFTAYLFSSGLFLVCLKLLYLSYEIVPIIDFDVQRVFINKHQLLIAIGQIFYLALVFAAPLVGALLISDILIAIVARFAQQLNALIFILPIKAVIAAVFYVTFLKVLMPEVASLFLDGSDMITGILKAMAQSDE